MANKQSILVIEDEKNIGNYIETILASNGYKVLRAINGMTGLSLCTSHFPEVILLDLGLPDLDGMEVLQQIRGFSDLPIIVISARTQEKEKVEEKARLEQMKDTKEEKQTAKKPGRPSKNGAGKKSQG